MHELEDPAGYDDQDFLLGGLGRLDQRLPADAAADVVRREHGVERNPLLGATRGGAADVDQFVVGSGPSVRSDWKNSRRFSAVIEAISPSSCSLGNMP